MPHKKHSLQNADPFQFDWSATLAEHPELLNHLIEMTLFETMAEGVAVHRVIYDAERKPVDYEIVMVNPAYEKHTGIAAPQVVGRLASEVYGTPPLFLELYEEVARTGMPRSFEAVMPGGQRHYSISVSSPSRGWFVTIFVNCTERKRQDVEIRRLNRLYAVLSQINQAVLRFSTRDDLFPEVCHIAVSFGEFKLAWIGVIDEETHAIVRVAAAGEDTSFVDKLDLCVDYERPEGRGPTGTAAREGRPSICNDIATDPLTIPWRAASAEFGVKSLASLPILTSGKVFAVLVVYAGETDFFQSKEVQLLEEVAADISFAIGNMEREARRRRTEQALRDSEEKFRCLFAASPDATLLLDRDGFFDCNEATLKIFGYATREQIIGKHPRDISAPIQPDGLDAASSAQAHIEAAYLEGNQFFEWRGRRSDGTLFPAEVSISRFELEGRLVLQAVVRDISWRKATERQLRQLSRVVQQSPNTVIITDTKGCIEYVNPKFTAITGYSFQEVIGKTPGILKSGETPREVYEKLWATITAGGEWHGELKNKRKNGEAFWESTSISPITNEQGVITHYLAIKEDITERKQMEEKYLRAQRMESIGSLAGGVAHDLNNILAPIMMSASILREEPPGEIHNQLVATIEDAAKRGSDIVQQVLTFARGVEGQRACLEPQVLIGQMARIIRETFPKAITFATPLPERLWMINGDSTQLHQVLLNLCVNARDAMPHGGHLVLTAENCEVDENFAAMAPDAITGRYVKLTVSDSGTGIPPEVIGKIFDPFFTTKEFGKGTGLGLSTVIGIVKSHGGFVMVDSCPGKGTSFEVFIPVAPDEQESRPEATDSLPPPSGNGELILIADDEAEILKVIGTVLMRNNYAVVTAADGIEALTEYLKNPALIKMVITDVMMPHMDGVNLVRALKKFNPHLTIVAATGHGTEASETEMKALGTVAFLRKPFTADQLLRTIHAVLHKGAGE